MLLLYFLFNSISFAETIHLKSGRKIEGKIIKRTDEKVRIEFQGTVLTFWSDEIERIDNGGSQAQGQSSQVDSPITQEENLYQKAVSKLKEQPPGSGFYIHQILPDIVQNGWKEDPRVIALLNNNQEAIDLFKEAINQDGGYLFGNNKEFLNTKLATHNQFAAINLFRLMLIQASDYTAKKKYTDAQDNYLDNVKFLKNLCAKEPKLMLIVIYRQIFLDIFEPMITQVIEKNYFDKTFYQDMLRELLLVKDYENYLKDLLKSEDEFALITMQNLKDSARQKGVPNWEFFSEYIPRYQKQSQKILQYQLNTIDTKSEEMFNPKVEELLGSIDEEQLDKYTQELKNLSFEETKDGNFTYTKEAIEQYISIFSRDEDLAIKIGLISKVRSAPRFISTYYSVVAKQNNILIATAIKLYQLDNGHLPEKLDNLVPQYLPAIPSDPFNHFQPVKYVKKENGYLLYSFGPDRIDQLGKTKYKSERADNNEGDIVFAVFQ